VRGVIHGNQGREPPNKTPPAVRESVIGLAMGELAEYNYAHLADTLAEERGITLSDETLRNWLRPLGHGPPVRRGKKHRRRHRAGTPANKTELVHLFSAFRGQKKRRGRFGWCAAYLPGRDEPLTLVVFSNRQGEPVALLTNRLCRNARHALCIIGDYLGRWHGAEDPVRFLKQAFRLETFLADGVDAIRAWFFLILVPFSLLFTLRRGREILRWILRYAQAFDKEVHFAYYRILCGFRRLERSVQFPLLGSFPPPRPP